MRSRELSDEIRTNASAVRQRGVLTRSQLQAWGYRQPMIDSQLEAGRWSRWGDHVIVLHNSEMSRQQLMWAAVLEAGAPAAICSHTALEQQGFKGFADESRAVHLLIPRGSKLSLPGRVEGLVLHESRRVRPDGHIICDGLPCTPPALAAIDSAAWQRWPRFACAQLAAVVQQRLCTADDLDRMLRTVGRVRHVQHMRLAIQDIRGGSDALSEIDLVRLCDRYGLQRPDQQVRRRDKDGRWRYLDAVWRLADGRTVVLEIDGSHHVDVGSWQDDIRRERDIVISGKSVLRATAVEARLEQGRLATDLEAAGIPKTCQTLGGS